MGIVLGSISAINAEEGDLNLTDDNFAVPDDLNIASNSNSEVLEDFNFSDSNTSGSNISDSNSSNNGSFEELGNDNIANKTATSIISSNIEMYYKNGTIFQVKLLDSENNPIANQTIKLLINGEFYSRKTNENGIAGMKINLGPGKYNILTIFNGTDLYEKSENNGSVTVLSTIICDDVVKYYKNGTQFYAYFLDGHGNPLVNADVSFNINGEFYNRVTKDNGSAKLNINLGPGEHVITAIHSNGLQQSANIRVLSNVVADDVVKYYRNGTQFYAYFLDDCGNPLVNETVHFNINGVIYDRVTKDNGSAKLNINLGPGDYVLTAIHSNGLQQSADIRVLSTIYGIDLVKAYLDKNQYTAYFVDGKGERLVNTSVSFNIHGLIYNRTTDNNGSARLNINLGPGEYILTAYNSNDGLYMSNTIHVLKDVKTIIDVENVTFMENDTKSISIRLYDELNNTLENKSVVLTVNNKNYLAATDENGNATFNIELPAGLFDAKYEFAGNIAYQSSNELRFIRVLNGIDVCVEVLDKYSYKMDSFNVRILDLNGTPLDNVTVTFIINNKMENVVTDGEGIAKATINLKVGTHKISYYVNQPKYDNLTRNATLIVIPSNQASFSTSVTSFYDDTNSKFSVTLSDGTIKLPNEIVSFVVNGQTYDEITNSKGLATLNVNLPHGDYDISVFFAGNSKIKNVSTIFKLVVMQRLETNLEYLGEYAYNKADNQNVFEVKLTDSNNNLLSNKEVIFTLNGIESKKITNDQGVASLDINLDVGFYNVYYKFNALEQYLGSSGVQEIRVINFDKSGNGYWLWGAHMYQANLASLAQQGTTDIFLLSAAISTHGESNVVQWIAKAKSYGIRVHIWMLTFYDGSFISPVLSDGTPNYNLFNTRINQAKYYASLPGVSGIHLDYLRFPGNAYKYSGSVSAINQFVKSCGDAIRAINPNIIYSAAVMPEPSGNAYYYGQDVSTLGKYLDVIVPMIYKGNYNSGTGWIGSTTKWFVQHSSGAQIWTGLQAYYSDGYVSPLPVSELFADAKAAIDNGASGVVMFRWGVTNFIDFKNL